MESNETNKTCCFGYHHSCGECPYDGECEGFGDSVTPHDECGDSRSFIERIRDEVSYGITGKREVE